MGYYDPPEELTRDEWEIFLDIAERRYEEWKDRIAEEGRPEWTERARFVSDESEDEDA